MILTEQEATTKWCPLARAYDGVQGVGEGRTRKGQPSPGTQCLASGCMMWRWAERKAPEEIEARKSWNTNPVVPVGYCGA